MPRRGEEQCVRRAHCVRRGSPRPDATRRCISDVSRNCEVAPITRIASRSSRSSAPSAAGTTISARSSHGSVLDGTGCGNVGNNAPPCSMPSTGASNGGAGFEPALRFPVSPIFSLLRPTTRPPIRNRSANGISQSAWVQLRPQARRSVDDLDTRRPGVEVTAPLSPNPSTPSPNPVATGNDVSSRGPLLQSQVDGVRDHGCELGVFPSDTAGAQPIALRRKVLPPRYPRRHGPVSDCAGRGLSHCPTTSGRRDSNPRPQAWKASALPTELLPHALLNSRWSLDESRPHQQWWGKDSNLRRR